MMTSISETAPEMNPYPLPPKALSETHQAAAGVIKNIGYYKKALSGSLDPKIFAPHPMRLVTYVVCLLGAALTVFAIVSLPLAWPLKLLAGLLLGAFNGWLGFLSHELAHGSIVKNRKVQDFFCFFGMTPYLISPTYWRYSHNKLHHGQTQKLISDPDAFPNLRIFRNSKFMQFMFPFTPGSGHKRSIAYFFFWFSFHNLVAQVYMRFRNRIFESMDHRRVTLELAAQTAIAIAVLAYAGPSNWLWVAIIPVMVQNYMLMSYISTNHNLSPLGNENDPLANSLSVTNHPLFEKLHFNFGYHIEHHIYPTMSSIYAKEVHRALVEKFPDDYKIMPKWNAMKLLYKSPRIYKNAHELIHPETLQTTPTL